MTMDVQDNSVGSAQLTSPSSSTSTFALDEKPLKAAAVLYEPQNALTRKFTEEEWAALRQLRVAVANTFIFF